MSIYNTIKIDAIGTIANLWLNRPVVHNAIDDQMINELSDFFNAIEGNPEIRFVIIRGHGKSFCSGGDLEWMKASFLLSPEENLADCKRLTDLFEQIFNSNKVVISVVHGNVFGGGNGLVAVCDLACCLNDATFALSETRIGMAAASITPFMLNKVQPSVLKELIFTARPFNGLKAQGIGLINRSFPNLVELESNLEKTIRGMEKNSKQGLFESKRLINILRMKSMASEMEKIPALLARIRVSPEAQEGFSAFLEKRKPNWDKF